MADCVIYTDGGSRGNPGPAGAGWVITYNEKTKRNSKYLGKQTNNYAEYEAVVLALKDLKKVVARDKRSTTRIEIRMDSELVVRQLSGAYQIKDEPLQLQYMKIHNIRVADFPNMTFTHVPREKNNLADGLANQAMDGAEQKGLF